MTVTEQLISDWAARKASSVTFPTLEGWAGYSELQFPNSYIGVTPWTTFVLPIGKEMMSFQTTEVFFPAETKEFIPRTALGRKLASLRKRAIEAGMRLLSEDEVLEEVKRRRGELENDEENIY